MAHIPTRVVVPALIGVLAMAACGDDDAGGARDAAATSTAEAVEMVVPATWQQADGSSITVPTDPRRILALDPVAAELLVASGNGHRIVGIAESAAGFEKDNPALAVLPTIGDETAPNLEAAAALRPDLIVAYDEFAEAEELARIAPFGTIPYVDGFSWRQYFQDTGDRLGLSDFTRGFVERIDARIEEIAGRVPDGTTMALLRVNGDGTYGMYPGFYPADLIAALGMDPADTPLAFDSDGDPCCTDMSAEGLGVFTDVDVIFLADNPNNTDEALAIARDNPVFAALPAVEDGRVHVVSSFPWISWTPMGLHEALDDVERFVLEEDS